MGDRGWDYLNSSGDDFDYDKDNDGSWGYENSDGSGSYYGSDGSWGYKNSDGSASYYGSDGSWGYRNSDGSTSYYGNDGSWGYRNSDGSGSFYDGDGSSGSDDSSSGASLLGGLIGLGLAAYAIAKCDDDNYSDYDNDNDDDDDDDYYSDNGSSSSYYRGANQISSHISSTPPLLSKGDVRGKRIKAFLFKHKKIKVEYSSSSLVGKNADEVYALLYNCGFKHIKRNDVKDIYANSPFRENEVDRIEFNGQSQFYANSEFPYDAKVIITIHQKKEIAIPFSASSLRKQNYNEVYSQLTSVGFTEVYTSPIKDLVTGWITKDGSVDKVFINGSDRFKKNMIFKYDVNITVQYHTFNK